MTKQRPDFQPVEIDELDRKLSNTAKRKRIPSLKLDTVTEEHADSRHQQPVSMIAPRKPISLEVPDYLATELKVSAAQRSVTVRHLVLTALAAAGYEIKAVDIDEDGRRYR